MSTIPLSSLYPISDSNNHILFQEYLLNVQTLAKELKNSSLTQDPLYTLQKELEALPTSLKEIFEKQLDSRELKEAFIQLLEDSAEKIAELAIQFDRSPLTIAIIALYLKLDTIEDVATILELLELELLEKLTTKIKADLKISLKKKAPQKPLFSTKLFLKIYFIAIPLIVIPLMYRCIKGYKNKTTPENIKLPEETQFSRLLKFREKVDSLNWPEIIPVVTCSEEYAEQLAKRRPLPPISEIQLPFF